MAAVLDLGGLTDSLLNLRDLNKIVKVDLRITRKTGIILAMAVEQSLLWTDPANLMNGIISDEDRAKLKELETEILQKAEAEEFYGLVKKIAKR